ncbi:MAG: c-type cytochrome [Verrucomicrobia bacterium]|nr:c-type cytochrome [Verrucomicrobiota bacterium]MDA1069448.1 c-type cytochrome [Verrucomicrobiota bacterium]
MFKRLILAVVFTFGVNAGMAKPLPLKIKKGENIVLIGSGLGERMNYFPYFETELQRRYPEHNLIFRNICHPGDTPGFRPHPSRETQWAFPGAEAFHPQHAIHTGIGHYPYPDEWLSMLEADTILAFFGYNESFDGIEKADNFFYEVDAFIKHTLAQKYNGKSAPRLVLVSPIAYEDLSDKMDLPNGVEENKRLAAYAAAMKRAAKDNGVGFIDLFSPTLALYPVESTPQTINGFSLSDDGYRNLSGILANALYGQTEPSSWTSADLVYKAVKDKNWFWFNDYRMLNGVHAYGRRYAPYGDKNYPEEIAKIREMTALRDGKIHELVRGKTETLMVDDSKTLSLTPTETNFDFPIEFLDVNKALEGFTLPEGYKIDLFASESEFPDLRNPVQTAFDNKGRLWVSVLPSYPHYKPGDERPNDKILILEDTDGDGRADKQTVFADGLHLPIGFEIAPEGVYLSQEPNLVLLVDDDGDDQADRMELILHGFDSHDTHHAISAYSADASGAFYMSEGRFLHSQVETPYGPERCTDGGNWRFDPKSWKLERFMQTDVSNPWGITFNEWGQNFLSDASGGANWWSLPLSVKIPYGMEIEKVDQFTTHRVRPTSGTEFMYSRHFPDDVQGDFLICNSIGFLGIKQHKIWEDGAGYTGELRQDMLYSNDPNFRPVDIETAPDGSLYVIDWHNPLIGHMQHSARDPNRDNDHGRIYRITYPSRPLLEPAEIDGASLSTLFENLKAHEYRTRYRTRREIREHDAKKVIPAIKKWASSLDKSDPNFNRHLLEALWVTWGQNRVDEKLLKQCLESKSYDLRSAAVRVLRYAYSQVDGYEKLFMTAAVDEHPRVRLESVVAASWMDNDIGARIAVEGMKKPITKWMGPAYEAIMWTLGDRIESMALLGDLDVSANPTLASYLSGTLQFYDPKKKGNSNSVPQTNLPAAALKVFEIGHEVFNRDAHCATCHGEDGKGAIQDIYPPLNDNEWVMGNEDRFIKMVLKGLWGPIEVAGQQFDPTKGLPPMTGFEGILTDEEIAAVITYTRIQFGNKKVLSKVVDPADVARVREEVKGKVGFYMVDEILKMHPHD